VISAGCDHRMRAEASSCVCPGCGTVCTGLFKGCPDVWAARTEVAQPVIVRAKPTAAARAAIGAPKAASTGNGARRPPAVPSAAEPPRAAPSPVAADPVMAKPDSGPRKPKEGANRLRAEAEAMRETFERSFEEMAADLAARAREIDDRAAAHLRALDQDRASLPHELRKSMAEVLPGMVADAVRPALDARRPQLPTPEGEIRRSIAGVLPGMVAEAVRLAIDARPPERSARPSLDDIRQSVAGVLPGVVADAVDLAMEARPTTQPSSAPEGPRQRSEHDQIVAARQRSLEKRVDGLTRRDQEIDDRVTTHLRAIDDDRAALAELVRRQDQLERSIADADLTGRHERLVAWVNQAVPERVAAAVQATLEAHAAALSGTLERVERARADTEAVARTAQEASEGIIETLSRRDQEIDERAAAHLQVLEAERAELAKLLESGRDQVAQSVLIVLPAMVDDAVRTAMAGYATERRAPVLEMASRLRADADVMRDSLQRSFEKMMESLATREQELEERTAAQGRVVDREREELAELRGQVAASLTEGLPAMVADAVRAAEESHRAELDQARQEMERVRVESETATAALREAVADMRAAEQAQRKEAVERQAAASERAFEGLRSAVARPAAGAVARVRSATVAASASDTEPSPPDATADETPKGRPGPLARSTVPRARRVERRMLKIDDGDDHPWRPLDRRQADLSDLLDSRDH